MKIEDFILDRAMALQENLLSLFKKNYITRDEYEILIRPVLAMKDIVIWHKNWPVLVTGPVEMELVTRDYDTLADINQVAYRAQQQFQWLTTQQYIERFGEDPPTAPLLAKMAKRFEDHPDYQEEWDVQ